MLQGLHDLIDLMMGIDVAISRYMRSQMNLVFPGAGKDCDPSSSETLASY